MKQSNEADRRKTTDKHKNEDFLPPSQQTHLSLKTISARTNSALVNKNGTVMIVLSSAGDINGKPARDVASERLEEILFADEGKKLEVNGLR